mmetsp:Transcript_15881/g.31034  ORF Transcript_15881/g.31034 Transcript_15881/m.31034 type:complete len:90 (+) Transcript_15881:368-637(+)
MVSTKDIGGSRCRNEGDSFNMVTSPSTDSDACRGKDSFLSWPSFVIDVRSSDSRGRMDMGKFDRSTSVSEGHPKHKVLNASFAGLVLAS